MTSRALYHRALAITLAIGIATALAGCGSKEPPAAPATTPPVAPVAATPAGQAAPATTASWTPEALEDLLAPIALYPDPVLSQMLIASTNPQEVLDAGNWLLQQEGVKGKALDDAAAQVGFTPPIRALVQFPETVDMMCLELGWTTELGEAFTADQAGVLDAVQRLRKQAQDVGNLQSSAQMKVETEVQEDKEVIVLKPAQPEVVYVPQYDPQTAYAPVPAAAPATTTTTTTTTEEKGHSTGSMVATGVLAFGAGILVSEIFDDDDDYYHPNYGYGGMPYYPPYPYRPSYGGGYYPSNSYNRPPNYNSGFQNTGNIVINTGGNRPGNSGNAYWDRYDDKPRAGATGSSAYNRNRTTSSPISAARPNRPEMQELNKRQPRPMPADVKRPSPDATVNNWKGQSGYAGKKPSSSQSAADRVAGATPGYSRPPPAKAGTREGQGKSPPKVQGSYAGARDTQRTQGNKPATASRDAQRPTPSTRDAQRPPANKPSTGSRDIQRPSSGQGDRGYGGTSQRPAPSTRPQSTQRPAPSAGGGKQHSTAVSGANRGSADRAASQRGKQSMPKGAHSKGGGQKQNRR